MGNQKTILAVLIGVLSVMTINASERYYKARPSQYEILRELTTPLGKPYGGFIAGVGAGKTATGAHFSLDRIILNPETVGLIAANTYKQLHQSTIPGFTKWLREYKIDYVLNKEPRKFGYRSRFEEHNGIMSFRNGAQIILRTLSNYDDLRGTELGWFWLDETRDTEEEAFDVVLGRMREPRSIKHCGLITTTPNGFDWLYERFANDQTNLYHYVTASTEENRKNLPAGYIERLFATYSKLQAEQEIKGRFVNLTQGQVYYAFSKENVVDAEFDPDRMVYMCWDFNATEKPMSVALIQIRHGLIYVVKEFVHQFTQTETMCKIIQDYFRENNFTGELRVVGDSAGRNIQTTASWSDYTIIENYFGHHPHFRIDYRKTHRVVDRTNALNALLCNSVGYRQLFVDRRCVKLIRDFERVVWEENGMREDQQKDKSLTHISSAVSYYAYNYHEIKRIQRS